LITSIHDGSQRFNKSDDIEFERVTRQVLAEAGDKVGKMAIENTSAAGSHGHDQVGLQGAQERHADGWMSAQQIVEGHL
jgi:hypothetical protein